MLEGSGLIESVLGDKGLCDSEIKSSCEVEDSDNGIGELHLETSKLCNVVILKSFSVPFKALGKFGVNQRDGFSDVTLRFILGPKAFFDARGVDFPLHIAPGAYEQLTHSAISSLAMPPSILIGDQNSRM